MGRIYRGSDDDTLALRDKSAQLEELERDVDGILEDYARMTPESLDALTPEERHQFYKILRLKVVAHSDDAPEIQLPFRTGTVCLPSEKNVTLF